VNYSFPYPSQRSPVLARNIVATSQPLAAQAGLRMLLAGGNAVDASLAAAITLTVVEPTANGAGSDAFAVVWDGRELHGLNASGRSPAAWRPERFAAASEMPRRGWESVTVPGAVSAWVALSRRFGKLPFARLFEPAIGYAREGFAVSPVIATLWARIADSYRGQPGFDATFLPHGRPPRAGERFANPELAATLELIAASEGREFYAGSLAEAMARHSAACGGALTVDDLAEHQVDWCGTLQQPVAGAVLHEIPPNGQGIAALMAVGILERLHVERHPPDSPEALHLEIEAMKLALADIAAFVADPAAMDVDPRWLLRAAYLDERAALVDRRRAGDFGAGAPRAGGTVYLTAADAGGMMVSMIQSNYEGFGSGVVVPGTGISLQNRGYGFVLEPGHPNQVGPRKRPFHTIIPGFLMREGKPLMSFGVMGGSMQAQGHLQMVTRTLIFGQNPQSASDAPRWRVLQGRQVAVESTMPAAVVAALRERGHLIQQEPADNPFAFGGAQLIYCGDCGYVAGSDHRKDGCAVGY
jgi:gamma-glutamyltranspeptidase/glutathione hydrolase